MPGAATLNAAPGQGTSSLFGRDCVHGATLTFAREHEALVAVLGDLGALPAVPVPVVNQIRTYWWCSPPRTGRQRCQEIVCVPKMGKGSTRDRLDSHPGDALLIAPV